MKNYMVLIPSKGRSGSLRKLLRACPMLNAPTTLIGLDDTHIHPSGLATGDYGRLFSESTADKVRVVSVYNSGGYTSVARERLRRAAMDLGGARRYVLADDNCVFDNTSLVNLLRAQSAWDSSIMAGGHPTAKHFHAEQIAKTTETRGASSSYEQVGMIYWCIPHRLYKKFTYPDDCYFDDVYFILWCMSNGFVEFRSTLDAPFNKHLHEPGGTGSPADRIRKRGIGFARLAMDFPQFMTTDILTTRVPYKRIIRAIKAGKDHV